VQADEDAFFKFVEQDKYLSKNKGSYAEAYAARAPWAHRFDLRLHKTSASILADVKTPCNSRRLPELWKPHQQRMGCLQTNSLANNGRILRYEGRDASNVPSFSMAKNSAGEYLTESYSPLYNVNQTWRLQFGVRYIF
jgi:hypothetical protein